MTMTVNLVGTGRVGRTLLRRLAVCDGVTVNSVASRCFESALAAVDEAGVGISCQIKDMTPADLWFLTVPDTKIGDVAADIAGRALAPSVAVHCSGFYRADVMAPLGRAGWRLASAHPMLSFADPMVSAERFPGTWVGIEGEADAVPVAAEVFEALGARTFPIASQGKALYHAAAVITNNFTTVLQAVALEAWAKAGVPADVARDLNATLLRSTVENIEKFGPAEALTGPAARGDRDVVTEQGRQVAEWRPDAGFLYELLSKMAVNLKTTGATSDDQDPLPRQ